MFRVFLEHIGSHPRSERDTKRDRDLVRTALRFAERGGKKILVGMLSTHALRSQRGVRELVGGKTTGDSKGATQKGGRKDGHSGGKEGKGKGQEWA